MREMALFAGAGGGILGGVLLGWECVCAVEIDPYCQDVLRARQRDGILSEFPVYGDIREFDGSPWRGKIDVISGGFPCQDISAAGRGAGIGGERSGLWGEYARIIREVRPRYVFVENSPMLTARGLGRVLGDLAAMGFDAEWCVLGADDAGAPHVRKRIWILATHPDRKRIRNEEQRQASGRVDVQDGRRAIATDDGAQGAVADNSSDRRGSWGTRGSDSGGEGKPESALCDADSERQLQSSELIHKERGRPSNASWWAAESDVGRVSDGLAEELDCDGSDDLE